MAEFLIRACYILLTFGTRGYAVVRTNVGQMNESNYFLVGLH